MTLVLDASVVLAYLLLEVGWEAAEAAAASGVITTVSLAEVVTGLVNAGENGEGAERIVRALELPVVPLDMEAALVAGRLRERTRTFGLSLGDRCCLAYAVARGLPVATMDRVWAGLALGVEVRVLR